MIAQRTQLYGARRPSTKIEAVTIDNPTKDFDLKDNTLTLRELHGNAVWEDLRINVADLSAIICDLKDYGESEAPGPNPTREHRSVQPIISSGFSPNF
jgi:hypothetical protein